MEKPRRYELADGARLAADTISRYYEGRAYRATIVDERTIDVELLDPTIGFGPANRIAEAAREDASVPAGWLDDEYA
jgi:hypothetical protein